MFRFAAALLAAAATLSAGPAGAQAPAFPSKPIRIVTITPPGAVSDMLARLIAEEIHKDTGATVMVENRPGALGTLAAETVARAAPDGYTVLGSTISTHAQNPALVKNIRYDPIADFEQVSRLALFQWVLVANPQLGFRTVKDLVDAAKAAPGKVSFGYATGSALAATRAFTNATGIEMLPVAYKGTPPALNDVIGGQIGTMIVDVAVAAPHIQSGRIRALAVASEQRAPQIPDVPTYREAGVQGADFVGWSGLSAPANTPPAAVKWLDEAVRKVMARKDVQDRMTSMGILPGYLPGADYKAFMQSEIAVWAKRIRDAGLEAQ